MSNIRKLDVFEEKEGRATSDFEPAERFLCFLVIFCVWQLANWHLGNHEILKTVHVVII